MEREYGYKSTLVNGTDFKIKEKFEGTHLSTVGRRLAAREDVSSVIVEHTGVITVYVKRTEHWNVSDIVPEGWCIEDVMPHPSTLRSANVHLDIAQQG